MDYSVNLTAKDNLSGTIKQCKQAVQEFGNAASTNMDKFRQRFEKIEGSAAPLKKQLRDLRALMSEMNFKGMSGTEEFTRIAQYAGQVKDAMDDAGAAAKRFADDTFALKAAADAVNLVTGAFTAVTGAMNLFGVKNEEVKNAILKVQSAMAILNGVQAVANALNKDSALMQALKAMKMRYTTEMIRLNSLETNKNTIAEVANKVASEADAAAKTKAAIATNIESATTKKSTIVQNAWNIAKAVAKALIGDFTGLAIVAAGAIATYAMATADSTDEIENQTDALDDNNSKLSEHQREVKRAKELQEQYTDAVSSGIADQLTQYRYLQAKWQECNGDVKLQQKFLHDYEGQIKSLTGRVLDLVSAEDFFVKKTPEVISAIIARQRAEAFGEIIKEKEKDFWKWRMQQEEEWKEQSDINKHPLTNAEIDEYFKSHPDVAKKYTHTSEKWVQGDYLGTAKKQTTKWIDYDAARKDAGIIDAQLFQRTYAISRNITNRQAQFDKEIEEHTKRRIDLENEAAEKAKAAGMAYERPKGAYSPSGNAGGSHGGSHGGSGHRGGSGSHGGSGSKGGSGTKKPNEPSDEEKLRKLESTILDMQSKLSLNLIDPSEVEKFKNEMANLIQQYDYLADKLGAPKTGSYNWLKKELSYMEDLRDSGFITEDNMDRAKAVVKILKDGIEEEEINLGIKDPKTLEEKIDDEISELQKYLDNNIEILSDATIEETKNKIKKLTKQKYELRIKLGLEEPLRTDFEKNSFADKYINDWQNLERYANEYAKKWEEYQAALKKYEADMAAYNAAQQKYAENVKLYEERKKQYDKLAKIQKDLEQLEEDYQNNRISRDKYLDRKDKLDAQLAAQQDLLIAQIDWNDAAEEGATDASDLNESLAKLHEQYQKGLITLEQYNEEQEKLFNVSLKNTQVPGLAKLIKPKIELPKKPFNPLVHALIEEIYGALDEIPAHTQKLLNEVDEMLNNNELPVGVRIELANNVKKQLQDKLDEQVHGKLTIKAEVEPEYVESGSKWDMRKSYENQSQKIQGVADDYAKGIIKTSGEARQQIAKLNAELIKLGLKPIEIEIKTKGQEALENTQKYLGQFNDVVVGTVDSIGTLVKSIDEGASGWEIFKNAISTAEQIMNSIGIVMQTVNTLTQAHTAATMANTVATTADAAASTGNAAAKTAEAGATAGVAVAETAAQNAKMGPWGWIAAIAGAVALAAVLFSTIGKFAGGGIIGGHSYSGDKLIARVNSGEMILNSRQQRNLFNAINRGDIGGQNAQSISFRIKGSDLYGTLKNYSKIKGKSGITTGIQ